MATKATSKHATLASVRKNKKPTLKKVPISLDGEKAAEFNAAQRAFDAADAAVEDDPRNKVKLARLEEARLALEELRPEVEDGLVEFVFRSIGRQGYEDIVSACPPTKEQRAAAAKKQEDVNWNETTFPPSLIAAALISPEATEEEVFELWDDPDWNQAELIALFVAALQANQETTVADLGKGSGLTLV